MEERITASGSEIIVAAGKTWGNSNQFYSPKCFSICRVISMHTCNSLSVTIT